MQVFAYIQNPRGFLPRVVYVPIKNINKNDLSMFESVACKRTSNGMTFNTIRCDKNTPKEIMDRIQIYDRHSEDAPHRFGDEFNNDPDFKDSIAYFPCAHEHNLTYESLIFKFISATRIGNVDIDVVDHVITTW